MKTWVHFPPKIRKDIRFCNEFNFFCADALIYSLLLFIIIVYVCYQTGLVWSISLENFLKHIPLIYEEWNSLLCTLIVHVIFTCNVQSIYLNDYRIFFRNLSFVVGSSEFVLVPLWIIMLSKSWFACHWRSYKLELSLMYKVKKYLVCMRTSFLTTPVLLQLTLLVVVSRPLLDKI